LIALSLIKVEIMAALKGVRLVVWLEKLTRDLRERNNNNPFIPTLYCDNKGIVDLLYDMKHYQKAKYIET
jgi:methylaspartate ammonia-lyase